MRVYAVPGLGVFAYAKARVQDQAIETGEFGGELFCYGIRLVEILEFNLDGFYTGDVAVFL